ncbi:hypothetical protein H0H81_009082 [Sphagnurus paluster]|uniref:Uncharacterized protein n=1 Tax=Sphagnurus paluster TaxID=117069 RepID=A0A9P7KIV8_9AGAR|nr:hypothetical protein H0H81_009082 [Sphagnurus paluster]
MARGAQTTPPPSELPKVSFEKIDEDDNYPYGVHDGQARAFGYNDFSEFHRPDSYIRHIEPLESELAKQVEYDMDEQDKEWLDTLNRERKKEQLTQITYEMFEVIVDRLEKEWFNMTKNIPKPDLAMPSEDSTCAICDDAEGENSNAIVFCDGCNLAVHQDCYGVPYIPEGQWLCRKCTVSPENPVSCILCPNEGGAFKQTVQGEWVHLLCAIWVPETRVLNEVFMEPVTGIDAISKQRWKLKEQQEARAAALAQEGSDSDSAQQQNAKSARAYAKTYKPGPPLVPAIIVRRLDSYVQRFKISKRIPTLQLICRYWSLKREARRGAPLLKRLHLEPWTASAAGRPQTEVEKLMKLDFSGDSVDDWYVLQQLYHLLYDMELLRDLSLCAKKREKWKLEQARMVYNVLENSFFVHYNKLRTAFDKISSHDRQDHFKNPVSKQEVPDYFDIVKTPMCWTMIEAKIDKYEYWDVKTFKDDIDLVINNATLYNMPGTQFHKAALRIQTAAGPIIAELAASVASTSTPSAPAPAEAEVGDNGQLGPEPALNDMPTSSGVGDLEPPLDLLELLLSKDTIQNEIDILIDDTPLTSLFTYALPKAKPPPPPPPPPKAPKVKMPKVKRAPYVKRKGKEAVVVTDEDVNTITGEVHAGEVISNPNAMSPKGTVAESSMPVSSQAEAANGEETIDEEAVDLPTAEVTTMRAARGRGRGSNAVASQAEEFEAGAFSPAADPDGLIGPAKRGRQKRTSSIPGQTELLPLVDSVDNQRSFKMFDVGWIFPPDQRRGGRAPPVERQQSTSAVAPRQKKRQRTDAGPSRLSVVSTAASDNETLEESVFDQQESSINDASMEIDTVPVGDIMPLSTTRPRRAPPAPSAAVPEPVPPVKVVQMENGRVILEELDTPAIRREKAIRRREERQRLAAENATLVGPGAPGAVSQPGRGRVSRKKKNKQDDESQMSSASDYGSEGEDIESEPEPTEKLTASVPPSKAISKAPRKKRGRPAASTSDIDNTCQVLLEGNKMLEGGTLVWAKVGNYPWWPAVIYEDSDPLVPPSVLRKALDSRQKSKRKIHILQFFEKTRTWQFLPLDKLRMLGEDQGKHCGLTYGRTILIPLPDFDDDMLATESSRQKWKPSHKGMMEQCRDAYQEALAEMETMSDLAENENEENQTEVAAVE